MLKDVANVITGIGFGGGVVTAVWMTSTPHEHVPEDLFFEQMTCLFISMGVLIVAIALHRFVKTQSILDALGVLALAVFPTSVQLIHIGIRDGVKWKFILGTLAIVLFVVPILTLGVYRERQMRRAIAMKR